MKLTQNEKRGLIRLVFNEYQARLLEMLLFENDETETKTEKEKDNSNIKIIDLLLELGVTPNLIGFDYIVEALSMKKNSAKMKVTDIYSQIAKKNQITPSRVERAIRHAIEKAWSNGNFELQSKMFGYSVDKKIRKPTNSVFIATLLLHIGQ